MSVNALFFTGLTTGLIAGGASCAAVQGGLLAGALTGRTPAAPVSSARSNTGPQARRTRPASSGYDDTAAIGSVGPGNRGKPPVPRRKNPGRGTAESSATATLVRGKPVAVPKPPPQSLRAPLTAFLGAKLVSHTLLGAALGAFGAALEPGPKLRGSFLVLAALLMLLFALDMFGVRAVHKLVPRPPASWGKLVRRTTRKQSAGISLAKPAVLGFLTVLLPCGVTMSVALLAITSGSVAAGAAVMAGFVLGTAPLFAVLGFLLRKSTKVVQGRLTKVTGVVVLLVALWTMSSGLRVGGWFDVTSLAASSSTSAGSTESAGAVTTDATGSQVITLDVTDYAYEPARVEAKAGVPTTLVLRTNDTQGCTRAFVIPSGGFQQVLPATGNTEVPLGKPQPGILRYTCSMGMYGGSIDFTGDSS
ncbi:sulfite exporter TauE/SafE family protein [Blastococcus saxobsidens]|uniref:Sulfite exporter TauE/SafE family protein n=1 Tax=Blastococcus saxobsidens (strain DD2) TaxID=1146883 RepID=H6RQ42_BLASD|nr:sulfite exporter TauE/SafE family protein [Blastococcus saxobsidens]CCG02811.1 conserved membrane protein of unknown function [Blastococcus saxobsidens DD2]